MLLVVGIILVLSASIVIGEVGAKREIGFWGAFFASFFFSPLIGVFITIASKRNADIAFEKEMLELQNQQLSLLRKKFGGDEEEVVVSTMPSKNDKYVLKEKGHILPPLIVNESEEDVSPLLGGKRKLIKIEFEDGVIAEIYHKVSNNIYYFKSNKYQYCYDGKQNCVTAVYNFLKGNGITEMGFIGTYS